MVESLVTGETTYMNLRQTGTRLPEVWFLLTRAASNDFSYIVPRDKNQLSVMVMPVLLALAEGVMNGYVQLVDPCGDPLDAPKSCDSTRLFHPSSVVPVATPGLLSLDGLPNEPRSNFSVAVMWRLRRVTLNAKMGTRPAPGLSLTAFLTACVVLQEGINSELYIEDIPKCLRQSLTPKFALKLKGVFRTTRQFTTAAARVTAAGHKAIATLTGSTEVARQLLEEPYLTVALLMLELSDPGLIPVLVARGGGAIANANKRETVRELIHDRVGDAFDDGLSYSKWALGDESGHHLVHLLGSWRHDVLRTPSEIASVLKGSGVSATPAQMRGLSA